MHRTHGCCERESTGIPQLMPVTPVGQFVTDRHTGMTPDQSIYAKSLIGHVIICPTRQTLNISLSH